MPDDHTDQPPDRRASWQSGPSDDLVWAEFDDGYVVYHRPSGKTHFLNAASAVLLTEILLVPRDAADAARELAALEQTDGDAAFAAAVADSLHHLEYLGLVERRDG